MATEKPWNLAEVQEWKISVRTSQRDNHVMFGGRENDFFESTDRDKKLLKKKIKYAMFGPLTNESPSLERQEKQRLEKVFNLVCKKNARQNSFQVSFLCIDCLTRKGGFISSVICLHLNGKSVYIDNVPRSYNGFQDYLKNNRLPKCLMCYPASGTYYCTKGEIFEIQFQKSAACSIVNKILQGTDIASVAVGVATILVGVASIFFAPFAIPAVAIGTLVTGGALAAYTSGRSIERLVDRSERGQTLGLQSPEARGCWLTILGSAVFVTSAGAVFAVKQAIVRGATITSAVARVPFVMSLSASGLGVVNSFTGIVIKLIQGEKIDGSDWMYLVSSILFFANVVVTTYQVAANVSELVDNGVQTQNVLKESAVWARNKAECGSLVNPNAVIYLSPFKIFNTILSPEENLSTCFQDICQLLAATAKKSSKVHCTTAEYIVSILSNLCKFWNAFGNEMQSVVEWFCKIKGQKGLHGVFGEITAPEALKFAGTLVTMGSWLRNHKVAQIDRDQLAEIITFQDQAGTVRQEDGIQRWTEEFQRIFDFLKKEFKRQKTIYQEEFETVKRYSPHLSEGEFQEGEGITGTLNEFFWKKAVTQMQKDFSGDASLLKLSKGLLKASPGSSCLDDVDTGTKAYFFHGVTPAGSDQQLSREQYFSLVREKVGLMLDQDASLEVDEESRLAFFRDLPNNAEGISCVIVKCVPEDGFVAGNIFVVKGDAD